MCKEAHEKQILLSNSGSQGPAHGLCAELPRRIDRIRGSLDVYQHRETVVKSPERIPRIGKLKIALAARDQYILRLDHDLIFILDSDISPDGSAVISQSHPESNVLSWDDWIGIRIQVFNVKGTHALVAQGPSSRCSPSAELLCQVDRPPGTLDIRLHAEAMVGTGKSIRTFGKIDLIIPRPERSIPYLADDLVLVLNGESDSSGITRAI